MPVPSITTTYPSTNPVTGAPEAWIVETPYNGSWTDDQWWSAHRDAVRFSRANGHPLVT